MDTKTDALFVLAASIGGANPDEVIDSLERLFQHDAIRNAHVPAKGRDGYTALGLTFGDPLADDPMFCEATLPDGWRIQATDHAMHNALLDAHGNRRGSYFYKIAFWDRDAFWYPPLTRYSVYRDYDRTEGTTAVMVVDDAETETVLHAVEYTMDPNNWDDGKPARDACTAWLDERMPEWRNPAAYWTP